MSKLFTSDAIKIDWQGETYAGIEALQAYFRSYVFQQNFHWHMPDGTEYGPENKDAPVTNLSPLPPMVDGSVSLVEVAVETAGGTRYRAIDLFRLNDEGLVYELLVYRGPHVPEH